jgi:hypothetical protein
MADFAVVGEMKRALVAPVTGRRARGTSIAEGKVMRLALRASILVVSGALFACSAEPLPAQLSMETHGSAPATTPAASAECVAGERRSCKVALGSHDGVTSCFVGDEICSAGRFLPCGNPGPATLASDVTLVARCADGATPRWRHVAYAIDAPSNASGASRVTITAQTSGDDGARAFLPTTPVTVVDVPRDPLACNADGAGCAHDIVHLLGDVLGSQPTLRLHVTRTQTPDTIATPEIAFLTPVYDCVAAQ